MNGKPSPSHRDPGINEERIRAILRRVVDPEVGENIVAMGLVYFIDVAGDRVLIEMTMTSPACPVGEMLLDEVRCALEAALPESIVIEARLVWEPPWNPAMMEPETRRRFGWKPD